MPGGWWPVHVEAGCAVAVGLGEADPVPAADGAPDAMEIVLDAGQQPGTSGEVGVGADGGHQGAGPFGELHPDVAVSLARHE